MHTADASHAADDRTASPAPPASSGSRAGDEQDRRLRLLFVADMELWPLHSGIHLRLYELATGLAERHDVTLVMLSHHRRTTFPRSDRFAALHVVSYESCAFGRVDHRPPGALRGALQTVRSGTPQLVRGWRSDALVATLRDLRTTTSFDVTWATRGWFAEHALEAGLGPVVVDLPDVDSRLLRQRRPRLRAIVRTVTHGVELAAVRRWELGVGRRATAVVVCKADDAMAFGGARTAVVPNGVTIPALAAGAGERPDELLFVGNLEWGPNIDAVSLFARDVLPIIRRVRPSTRFVIAGRSPRPEVAALHDGNGCVVVADPADLTDLYRRATVVVVPMRHGSGTRLKVLEGLAHGKALVSTAVGAEGIDVISGIHCVHAELADEFAHACLWLLADRDARVALGNEGRAWVTAHAQWRHAVDRADQVVRSAVRARIPSRIAF